MIDYLSQNIWLIWVLAGIAWPFISGEKSFK